MNEPQRHVALARHLLGVVLDQKIENAVGVKLLGQIVGAGEFAAGKAFRGLEPRQMFRLPGAEVAGRLGDQQDLVVIER